MEIVPPNMRGILGIIYQIDFSVGFMLWPALAYFIRNDVYLQLVVAIPLMILLCLWWQVSFILNSSDPETPIK